MEKPERTFWPTQYFCYSSLSRLRQVCNLNNAFDYMFCFLNITLYHSPFLHYWAKFIMVTFNGCAICHSVSVPWFNYPFLYCWIFRLFLTCKAVMNILEHVGFFFFFPFGLFPWNKYILRSGNTGSKFMNTFMALETCCQIASKSIVLEYTEGFFRQIWEV